MKKKSVKQEVKEPVGLSYVVDMKGNATSVLMDIDVFDSLIAELEKLHEELHGPLVKTEVVKNKKAKPVAKKAKK